MRSFFLLLDETAKWEKITYAGIFACTVLAFVNLSKGHPHFEEPPVKLFGVVLNPYCLYESYMLFGNLLFGWMLVWNVYVMIT